MRSPLSTLSDIRTGSSSGTASGIIVGLSVILLIDIIRQLLTGQLRYSVLAGYLWNGLAFGLVIGLGSVGLSLTYDLLDFANFAHGDYMTAAAFIGWGTTFLIAGINKFDIGSLFFLGVGGTVYPGDLGVSVSGTPVAILGGVIVAAVAGAVLALLVDRFVYGSMRTAGAIQLLIASVGVAFVVRYLIVYVFTQQSFGLTVSAWSFGIDFPTGTLNIAAPSLLLIAISTVLLIAVHLMLTRTKLGKAMRAMAANRDLARATGIPSERIIRFTWIIGGGLAGIAGFLAVLMQGTITYTVGWTLLLLIFAAVIMGGIGSVYGAIVGGVIIGLITRVSLVWIPSSFTEAMAFVVMVIVLLIHPSGLFNIGGST